MKVFGVELATAVKVRIDPTARVRVYATTANEGGGVIRVGGVMPGPSERESYEQMEVLLRSIWVEMSRDPAEVKVFDRFVVETPNE